MSTDYCWPNRWKWSRAVVLVKCIGNLKVDFVGKKRESGAWSWPITGPECEMPSPHTAVAESSCTNSLQKFRSTRSVIGCSFFRSQDCTVGEKK